MRDIKSRALTPREAEQCYGFSPGTLANLRCKKRGPKFFKVGRKVLYFIEDFEKWLRQHPIMTNGSTSSKEENLTSEELT